MQKVQNEIQKARDDAGGAARVTATLPAPVRARLRPAMDRVYLHALPNDPERAARVTLQAINALIRDGSVDPIVRQQASQIASEAGADTPAAVIEAVHAWIQRHMPYVRDPRDIELLTAAPVAIQAIQQHGSYVEDCDGQVIVEAALLRALFGPDAVRTVIIKADKRAPTQWSHIFLEVRPSGRGPWTTLDPIMNGDAPSRPKKPVGWHPPKYYAREAIPVGVAGPTLAQWAKQRGMQTYVRGGGGGMGDWIPAQHESNAIAREMDVFAQIPELPNVPQEDGLSGWRLVPASSLGAIKSHTYAQQEGIGGLGAILSNAYAQGPITGYRPTTVAEDPQVVAGSAWWQGIGTVGGTVRTHGVKTAALSGVGDYIQFGALGAEADLAKQLITTATEVTTAIQTQALNAERAKLGLPPLGQGGQPQEGGGIPILAIGAVAVLGGLLLWSMSRRRRAA